VPVFIKSESQEKLKADHIARTPHRVKRVDFRSNYVDCQCGTRVLAIEDPQDLVSVAWQAHLRENGREARLTR
jgi:hypothetical protein